MYGLAVLCLLDCAVRCECEEDGLFGMARHAEIDCVCDMGRCGERRRGRHRNASSMMTIIYCVSQKTLCAPVKAVPFLPFVSDTSHFFLRDMWITQRKIL